MLIKWSVQQDPEKFEPLGPIEPLCADFDGDCFFVKNKAACYEYAPEEGMCPWMRKVRDA